MTAITHNRGNNKEKKPSWRYKKNNPQHLSIFLNIKDVGALKAIVRKGTANVLLMGWCVVSIASAQTAIIVVNIENRSFRSPVRNPKLKESFEPW